MRNRVFELKQDSGYTFLIGTREENPTNRSRERIARTLAGVWDDLFAEEEWVPPYGFELVPDDSPSEGENELPTFEPGKNYIVFVLLESNPQSAGSAVSEEREQEITAGILKAIRAGMGERSLNPKIGIVTLYNSSVRILESERVRPWAGMSAEEWVSANTRFVRRGEGLPYDPERRPRSLWD